MGPDAAGGPAPAESGEQAALLPADRHDFPYAIKGDIEQLVHTVLETLQRHLSEGEWDDPRARMPADLVTVIPT